MNVTIISTAFVLWVSSFIIFWDFHRSNFNFMKWLKSLHPGRVLFFLIVIPFGVSLALFSQHFYKWGEKVFGSGGLNTELMHVVILFFIYGMAFIGGKTAIGNYNIGVRPKGIVPELTSGMGLPGFSQIYKFFTLVLIAMWTLYLMLVAMWQVDEAFGLSATILASLGGVVYLFLPLCSYYQLVGRKMALAQVITLSFGGFCAMLGSLYLLFDWPGGPNILIAGLVFQFLSLCFGLLFRNKDKIGVGSNFILANNIHILFLILITVGIILF